MSMTVAGNTAFACVFPDEDPPGRRNNRAVRIKNSNKIKPTMTRG